MGKKTTTKGTNGNAAAGTSNATNSGNTALTIEAAMAKRKPTAKPVAAKPAPPAPAKAKRAEPEKPSYTQEEIALRAYFIAENRHAHGLPGDAHHDWLEAERQIMAEHRRAKSSGKPRNELS
jgi:hypothetical protein